MVTQEAYNELLGRLQDQRWRLNNLYKIRNVHGESVQFVMNVSQEALYTDMHYFNVVLKARQLGFSSFIMIYLLDCCLFNANQACGVIAHTRSDAEELFRNKIRFAYDNLPAWLRERVTASTETSRKLEFSNGSSILVGTSLRGGTFQKLHVSEYGKIAARYPEKAKEIKTGALNTVHAGQQIFIESTAEGRQGEFFELCETARKLQDAHTPLTTLDPKFFFFPWYKNPTYRMSEEDAGGVIVTNTMRAYLDTLPVTLEPQQVAWYVKKSELMGDMMKREFPSTPEESFEASLEGAYYTQQMQIVRRNGQIKYIPHEPTVPVHTFWDIGQGSDSMAIWFFQHIGNEYRFIRYHESAGEGWEFYTNYLKSLNYSFGTHYWPHDGNKRIIGTSVRTTKQIAEGLGINPIKIVPRTSSVQADILNRCRPVLQRCSFDAENTATGIAHLDAYRKEWNDKTGDWKDAPRHDASSHCADAFRTFAVGYQGRQDELRDDYEDLMNGPQYDVIASLDYDMFS